MAITHSICHGSHVMARLGRDGSVNLLDSSEFVKLPGASGQLGQVRVISMRNRLPIHHAAFFDWAPSTSVAVTAARSFSCSDACVGRYLGTRRRSFTRPRRRVVMAT